MKKKISKIVFGTLLFLLLFFYHSVFSFDELVITSLMLTGIEMLCILSGTIIINKFLISQFLYKKNTVLFGLLFIVIVFLVSKIIYYLDWGWYVVKGSLNEQNMETYHSPTYQIFASYLVVLLGSLFNLAYRLIADHLIAQHRYEELEKEKIRTELGFLKAQINPHFLFNSINTIYAHIDKKNNKAREIILKFSEMLRYQLYECNADQIDIEKEISYLFNFVELQQLRKDENLQVEFKLSGDMTGFEIAPLLLIPFIENAFKYVSTYEDGENKLLINLKRKGTSFYFDCYNTKDQWIVPSLKEEGGIGIGNVKRRLELLYPHKHFLNIMNNENSFKVELKIYTK